MVVRSRCLQSIGRSSSINSLSRCTIYTDWRPSYFFQVCLILRQLVHSKSGLHAIHLQTGVQSAPRTLCLSVHFRESKISNILLINLIKDHNSLVHNCNNSSNIINIFTQLNIAIIKCNIHYIQEELDS